MTKDKIEFIIKVDKATDRQLLEFIALEFGHQINKSAGSWKYATEILNSIK